METLTHRTLNDYLASERTVPCEKCKEEVAERDLAERQFVCPKCGKYNRVPARVRIACLTDAGSFREMNETVTFGNPIGFPDYDEKAEAAPARSADSPPASSSWNPSS